MSIMVVLLMQVQHIGYMYCVERDGRACDVVIRYYIPEVESHIGSHIVQYRSEVETQ